jgi:hypothetical protein
MKIVAVAESTKSILVAECRLIHAAAIDVVDIQFDSVRR